MPRRFRAFDTGCLLLAACLAQRVGGCTLATPLDGLSGGSATADTEAEKSCAAYICAWYDRMFACSAIAPYWYPARTEFVSTFMTSCLGWLRAPGTGLSPEVLSRCADYITASECIAFLSSSLSAACRPDPGQLPEGAACVFDDQCATLWCDLDDATGCGACRTAPREGESCLDAPCARGLVCSATSVCVQARTPGAPCTAEDVCPPRTTCVVQGDGGTGTCTIDAQSGAACSYDNSLPACDLYDGWYCDPSALTCAQLSWANPGEPCSNLADEPRLCKAGSCIDGVCCKRGSEGNPCGGEKDADCEGHLQCIGGACLRLDAARCE